MPSIQALVAQITLKDVIDIVVVTFLIYQALLIVRGTRAVQMLIGLGALLAFFWLGHAMQLHSVIWLLGHFFESSFIIAVILFQDQIRTALANFGTGRTLFRFFNRDTSRPWIDHVAQAAANLGHKKVGALMVLEKGQGLGNLKSTGIPLEADLHPGLVFAIFQSSGPLHDGAIIISEGKIVSAGCVLPLEQDVEVEHHLGTRHRAALSVTRETDCLAIAVSEESGKIQVAHQGMFYACSSVDKIAGYLRHFLSPQARGRAP